ncbi:hypothetical protein [Streptomyces sp. Ncost-T6T-1]|uniref:hypothetical protein n=1 Tax=Streptomyces sp. Ncost-T6T-1 TaxID=1100828 RepID=UPI001146BAE5|nr:hypothetical protein [Streptomyces sp. Ncost-T6T-1]
MEHAKADNESRPLQPGLTPPLRRCRLLLAGGVAMAFGLLCALVLLNVVSAEQASAVAVIIASGTASVKAVFAGQQRGGTVIED